jgi:hypothetical protein
MPSILGAVKPGEVWPEGRRKVKNEANNEVKKENYFTTSFTLRFTPCFAYKQSIRVTE